MAWADTTLGRQGGLTLARTAKCWPAGEQVLHCGGPGVRGAP